MIVDPIEVIEPGAAEVPVRHVEARRLDDLDRHAEAGRQCAAWCRYSAGCRAGRERGAACEAPSSAQTQGPLSSSDRLSQADP